MRQLVYRGVAAAFAAGTVAAPLGGQLLLKTASSHPMQYYISLPTGWTAQRQWPVVVVVADADRAFAATARAFVAARGGRPYIIVAPQVLTAGGTAQQHKADFSYPEAVWNGLGASGDRNCQFDRDGLDAVLADVQRAYNGDTRVFLTGWEAGGHVIWAELLRHPERIRAAALVSPNYIGRCVDESAVSSDPARASVPIVVLHGGASDGWAPGQPPLVQWQRASSLGAAHGYTAISEATVSPYTHGPMPTEVLARFDRLSKP